MTRDQASSASAHARRIGTAGELTVGELATRTGTTVSALHFYERQGLITPRRTAGNQRRYRPDAVLRVRIILAERAAGASLNAIRGLLAPLPDHHPPPSIDQWREFLVAWRSTLDDRITELERLRRPTEHEMIM